MSSPPPRSDERGSQGSRVFGANDEQQYSDEVFIAGVIDYRR